MSEHDEGALFESALVACRVSASLKIDEAFVRIDDALTAEPPSFYVSRSLVSPQPTDREEIDGTLRVTLLHRQNGTSLIEVSGEPLTFGPRVEVPSHLLR